MRREPWLAGLLVLALTLLGVSVCTGLGQASEHAEAAESYGTALSTQRVAIDAAEVTAALQDALVATLRDSIAGARAVNETEADSLIETVEADALDLDSIIKVVEVRVGAETQLMLRRARALDEQIHTNYERVIEVQAENITGLEVELGAVEKQALFNRTGWDVTKVSLSISMQESASWRAAYDAQKKSGTVWKIVSAVEAGLILLTR